MILTEQTTVPGAAIPLSAFKDHLRLGTGFADDGSEDALLETLLRAAMAAIEARTGKILLQRDFLWRIASWRRLDRQALPVAPVSALSEIKILDGQGGESVADSALYRLEPDTHRPAVVATGALLPSVPLGGGVTIAFQAGFAAAWDGVPHDLAQAVFLLAAHYHENRNAAGDGGAVIPFGVAALIERWRTVRILGGGRP